MLALWRGSRQGGRPLTQRRLTRTGIGWGCGRQEAHAPARAIRMAHNPAASIPELLPLNSRPNYIRLVHKNRSRHHPKRPPPHAGRGIPGQVERQKRRRVVHAWLHQLHVRFRQRPA